MSCAPQWATGITGAPVAEREPGHAGLGHHRPQVRVAGRGALRVEDHARAVAQSACSASLSTSAASAWPRYTGSWPSLRRIGPRTLTSNSEDLMRKTG